MPAAERVAQLVGSGEAGTAQDQDAHRLLPPRGGQRRAGVGGLRNQVHGEIIAHRASRGSGRKWPSSEPAPLDRVESDARQARSTDRSMNRLQAELQRLYFSGPEEPALAGADGRVRAMVLELARPASWDRLATLWRGVQADLELPAPAIAVSGIDGYQLWFSLSEPVPAARATAFLESLRRRYLGDVAPERIGMKASVLPPSSGGPVAGRRSWRRTWRHCSRTSPGSTRHRAPMRRPSCCPD